MKIKRFVCNLSLSQRPSPTENVYLHRDIKQKNKRLKEITLGKGHKVRQTFINKTEKQGDRVFPYWAASKPQMSQKKTPKPQTMRALLH